MRLIDADKIPWTDLSGGKGLCYVAFAEKVNVMPTIVCGCGDAVSRNAIVQKLNKMDRYVSTELRLCNTGEKFPQNEVFIVDDVYEEIVEQLPSAQPDIIRCKDCIYQTESWSGIKYCEAHGDHIGKDYDYCSNARRKENG